MKVQQVFEVVENQIVITLPEGFEGKKKLLITIDDRVDEYLKKIELLKKAATDPLFLSDIQEVEEDFNFVDNEQL
jgi:hypothetical protein